MNLSNLFVSAVVLQGAAILVDEFYFHHRRGLPLWERRGHPLDTLTVFLCLVFLLVFPANPTHLSIYAGLCVFSCLFITKDEAIHLKYCTPAENWLHSILFILHPVVFILAGVLWYQQISLAPLKFQAFLVLAFLIYQIGYWNIYAKSSRV